MSAHYSYFDYEGIPCRIESDRGDQGNAQIYRPSTGFVDGPKFTILHQAKPITKAEFDAMIIAIARHSHPEA